MVASTTALTSCLLSSHSTPSVWNSSRSRRQVILSKNGAAVWRSSHDFLFWPGVYWRFLRHLPHLSAFFPPGVTQWPRSGAVCHAIILRNASIYMRCGLKSGSGPLTRSSTTWISQTRLDFFFWPLVSQGSFCYKVTFIWCGINKFLEGERTSTKLDWNSHFASWRMWCASPHMISIFEK